MRKVSVNGLKLRQILKKSKGYSIDDQIFDLDISGKGPEYSLIFKNKSYLILLEEIGNNKVLLKINGKSAKIEEASEVQLTLEKLGISADIEHAVTDIKAPMPGKILEIKVSEGQEVEEGTPVVVLEAMKMENVIKTTGSGKVKEIKVKEGQNVEKNDVLVVF